MSKVKRKISGIEVPRQSLFDITTKQMKDFDRIQNLHRIIYIGQHTLPGSYGINVQFRELVNRINSSYCEGHLTGVFLQYSKYFCHVIEGSEVSLSRHLDAILQLKHVRRTKLLSEHHHINQRFLNTWTDMQGKAPKLLESMMKTNDQAIMKMVERVISKLYNLASRLRNTIRTASFQVSIEEEQQEVFELTSVTSSTKVSSDYDIIGRPYDTLPEIQCLVTLMESDFLQDMRHYAKYFGYVPTIITYSDIAWPISNDYVPKNVFDANVDIMDNKMLSRQEIL